MAPGVVRRVAFPDGYPSDEVPIGMLVVDWMRPQQERLKPVADLNVIKTTSKDYRWSSRESDGSSFDVVALAGTSAKRLQRKELWIEAKHSCLKRLCDYDDALPLIVKSEPAQSWLKSRMSSRDPNREKVHLVTMTLEFRACTVISLCDADKQHKTSLHVPTSAVTMGLGMPLPPAAVDVSAQHQRSTGDSDFAQKTVDKATIYSVEFTSYRVVMEADVCRLEPLRKSMFRGEESDKDSGDE